MKCKIKKIFTGATAGAIGITSSISGIPAIYANEFSEVSESIDVENIEEITEIPQRDIDNFLPMTPILPVNEDINSVVQIINTKSIDYAQYLDYEENRDKPGTIIINGVLSDKADEFWGLIDQNDGLLDIPEILDGKPVSEIKRYAFESTNLKSVIIPGSVQIIGYNAFYGCESLESVTLNEGLDDIIGGAFERTGIKSITIPNSVKYLGYNAFYYCENLESVTIGEGINFIGRYTFAESGLKSISIPANIESISEYAFYNCINLSEITFEEGLLEWIGSQAFKNDKPKVDEMGNPITIEKIILPDSLKYLDLETFRNSGIESVEFGTGLEEIPYLAFGENKITSVEFPENIKIIGNYAFIANEIKNLTIPGTVDIVRSASFAGNKIETLKLEEGLRGLQMGSFYGNQIKRVVIPSTVEMFEPSLDDAYAGNPSNKSVPILAFAHNPIEYIEIKESSVGPQMLALNMFVQGMTKDVINEWYLVWDSDMPFISYPQDCTGTLDDSSVKEIVLPSTVVYSIFDPIPIPKYAVISKSDTAYTMYSQIYNGKEPRPTSSINKDEWFADREHTIPVTFLDGSVNFEGVDYPSDKYVKGNVFRYYLVDLVTLEDGAVFVDEDGIESTTLQAKSLMNKEEVEELLANNTPVKKGYVFEGWEIDWTSFENSTEELLLDGDAPARYLVSDVKGIKPIFKKDGATIHLEADIATQVDALNTDFDAKIRVFGEVVGTLEPNQEFWYSLTDGYEFDVNKNVIGIKFDNLDSEISYDFVDSFVENCEDWQFVISDDKTKIYAKAPVEIRRIDENVPIKAHINNLAIKNSVGFFGDRTTKEIEVFLNFEGDEKYTSAVIAEFIFTPSFSVNVKEATPKDALSTLNDGTISLVSDIRYSFRRNTTYILKLDEEFVYTHDYGDVAQHVGEFTFSNTQINDIAYVPSTEDLEGDSPTWRFTLSKESDSIYVKTPSNLFLNENPDGIVQKNGKSTDILYKDGVSFDINNIGIRDITGIEDNYINGNLRAINVTVLTEDETVLGTSVIANLEKNNGDGGGNSGGGGGNGGGGGKTKPTEKPVVVPAEILIDPYLYGYPDGTVRPKGSITRAEVASILYRIYGDNTKKYSSSLYKYNDLVVGAWYNDAIGFVLEENIFVGYPDGSFKPNDPITREEISAVLARLLSEFEVPVDIEEKEVVAFSDVDNSWAKKDIEFLAQKGILFGYPDGEFKLKNSTMRSEFASLMNNLTNRPDEYKQDNIYTDLNSSAWYYDDVMSASNYAIKENK